MKYKIFLFLFLCLLSSSKLLPQDKCKIYGWVFDSLSKNPVSNVNVIIRGNNLGTTTDSSGFFLIKLSVGKKYTLVFSHITYDKTIRELSLNKYKEVEYRIYLKENGIELPEVSVRGERSFEDIRAQWIVDGSEFERLGEKNLEKALIYLFPDIVYPLNDRVLNDKDFTLYVNGKWVDTIYLNDIDPYNVKYVKIWKGWFGGEEWKGITIATPKGMPLINGDYVMLIVKK